MSELPSGTVTFLFTDIEGSTKLLEQLGPDLYGQVLTDQRHILRAAFAHFSGTEIDTQGDAFFVSFPRATEGVAAATRIQRDLATHGWPNDVAVRVRMGLHTGEPWVIKEGYVGMDVHRAARIAHVGHGGQVLLSETTTLLVHDGLPEGVALLDLGRHRMKDLRRPERIHQLAIEGLPSEFPALSSLEVVADPLITGGDPEIHLPRAVGASPYRGLASFQEADAPFFFGREDFTAELYDNVTRKPMTAVIVGSSGAGKSSVVAAGLLPRLRSEGDWLVLRLRPGSQPFHALAGVLLPLLEPELDETERLVSTAKLAEALLHREVALIHVVDRLLEKSKSGARVLLIADQFEELYTLCPDLEVRQGFVDELLEAVHQAAGKPPARLVLLLTLRADFMGQALTHRPFADELKEGALLLGPMNRTELQAAIEKPAEKQGAAFETGLVARILDDVGEEPGNLPLLEFALTLLWDQLDQGWLTHEAYEAIGRVDGALSRHADEVYARLGDEEQEQARRIFVQLVQPGEGTEDTRRVARQADLMGVDWKLVQRLADERLVVTGLDETGNKTVEVVHEALIRSWGRLRKWMTADREFRRWQEGLRAAQRAWEESAQDAGALLRGAPLVSAEDWLAQRDTELGGTEKAFIQASVAGRGERAEVEKTRLARERDLEQRALRRLRLIVTVLVAASVVGILLTAAIFNQNQTARRNETLANQNAATATVAQGLALDQAATAEAEAEGRATQQALAEAGEARAEQEADARATAQAEAVRDREIAEEQTRLTASRELAFATLNNLEVDPELSVLLALEALNVAYTQEAEEALHRAILAARIKLVLDSHTEGVAGIALSPDGQRVVTASFDDTAIVWDVVTGEELLKLAGHTGSVVDAAISPDGSLLATASNDDTVKIWDFNTGEELWQISEHEGNIWAVDFHPDGTTLATGGNDGLLKLWDAETMTELLSIEAHASEITDIQFSPDGTRLISGSEGGAAKIWNMATGEELVLLINDQPLISGVAFSPDGTRVAVASQGGLGIIMDAETGEELQLLIGHTSEVWGVDFSPDGEKIATSSADGTAKVWNVEYGFELLTLYGHEDRIHMGIFTPDGKHLVTASDDHTARIWDITPSHEELTLETEGAQELEYSLDGSYLTASSYFGPVWVYGTESGDVVQTLEGHTDWISGVEYSPDGTLLATGSDDTTAKIWDLQTGQELMSLSGGHESWINDVAFNPDGRFLATVGQGGFVNVWDLATGLQSVSLQVEGNNNQIWAVDFSPDGTQVAIGAHDTVELRDSVTGEVISTLEKHNTRIRDVIYSPDGTRLASSSWDGSVKIWDLEHNEEMLNIAAHNSPVWGMAFNSDWSKLVTGSADGTVKYWDASTGARLLTLAGHTDQVFSVAISPDGTRLASASSDDTVRFWVLPLEEVIVLAEGRVTRSLTEEECRQYLHLDACPPGP